MKNPNRFKLVGWLAGFALSGLLVIAACTGKAAKARLNIVHKPPTKPGVVANIAGEDITLDVLKGQATMEFNDLEKRQYELMMDQLKKLMADRLIGKEAKKANLSIDEFALKKITKGEIKVSDAEYKKFVEEKHIPETQITPQIKERIIAYIQSSKKQELIDAYLAKLTESNPVEAYFSKPRLDVNVEAGDAPFYGKANAKVTIIEFSDFQCPFCSRAADTVDQLKKKYGEKIKIAFKQFPLPMHQDARPASEASMCVNEQGTKKFWKFHDHVFKHQDKLDKDSLEKYAKESGADITKYKACVDSKKYAAYVQKDIEYGEKVGVRSTPTFFINGQLINGAVPIEQFSETIDDELNG